MALLNEDERSTYLLGCGGVGGIEKMVWYLAKQSDRSSFELHFVILAVAKE